MTAMKLGWMAVAKAQFDELRQRAANRERQDDFRRVHNEIVMALRNLEQALEKGEPVYNTRIGGGQVRIWVHNFLAVRYVVFPERRAGWILRYQAVPASWPDDE